jgi:hypothetical protein
MFKIAQKKVEENPFYGKKALFDLYGKGSAGTIAESTFKTALAAAYQEAKGSRDLLELFYSICFSIGGEAHRTTFQWFLEWLKGTDIRQYHKFVESDVIRQYTTLDNIIGTRVKTVKGKTTIADEWNALDKADIPTIASYLAKLIKKGSLVDKVTIAKFLSNVRTTKRQKRNRKTGDLIKGGRPLQDRTLQLMKKRAALYTELSKIMAWEVEGHKFRSLLC